MKYSAEQIVEQIKDTAAIDGQFGIDACRKSILAQLEIAKKYGDNKTLKTMLDEFVRRANNERLFNKNMVLACWQLIEERGGRRKYKKGMKFVARSGIIFEMSGWWNDSCVLAPQGGDDQCLLYLPTEIDECIDEQGWQILGGAK